jgi:hypothetical protein
MYHTMCPGKLTFHVATLLCLSCHLSSTSPTCKVNERKHIALPALHRRVAHPELHSFKPLTLVSLYRCLQLTNLRKLSILGPSSLHEGGLKALTALQCLEDLDLSICDFSGGMFQAIMERGSVRNSPGEQTLWRLSSGVSGLGLACDVLRCLQWSSTSYQMDGKLNVSSRSTLQLAATVLLC